MKAHLRERGRLCLALFFLLVGSVLFEPNAPQFVLTWRKPVAAAPLHAITDASSGSNITDGLMAYYSFNDGTAADSSGNGNDGTIQGDPEVVDGPEGQALKFGGYYDPDHIIVPNSDTLSFIDNFTFSTWFNLQSHISMDGWGNVSEYGFQALIAKSGDRTGLRLAVNRSTEDGLWYPHAFNGRCCDYGQVYLLSQGGGGADLNEWHMVSFTHGDGMVKLYLDGVLRGEKPASEFNLNPAMADEPVHIGLDGFYYGVEWYPINGTLDEIRIYNRALSEAEVQDLYRQVTYSVSGLVTNSSGDPIPEVTVSAGAGHSATTDASGAYTITTLASGTYVVRPQARDLFPSARVVRVPPNAQDQDFTTVPTYGTLEGQVRAQDSGAAICNARVSAGGKVGRTGTDGRYILTSVSPGLHAIRVSADGYEDYKSTVVIDTNTSTTHDVALKAINVGGYYLPYPGGTAYNCTQGNGGAVSHYGSWYYAFDFGMPDGHNVVAARDGRVVALEEEFSEPCHENTEACRNAANYVRIRHTDETDTLYWHLKYHSVAVEKNNIVYRGQVLGQADTTGYAFGSHLDFTRHKANEWNSIPTSFVDVAGDGVPKEGNRYTSGNYPAAPAVGALEMVEDTNPPHGSVQFRLTGQPTHTLRLSAFDYASDVTAMRLAAVEAEIHAATWRSFTGSLEWVAPAVFVQYKDANGNVSAVASDTLEAIGYEPIHTAFAIAPTVCVGAGLSLTNQTAPFCEQCGWTWDFGNGTTSEEAEPQFDYVAMSSFYGYATPGMYTVTLAVTSAVSITSASHQVAALPAPSAAFTLIRSGATITVEAQSTDATSWTWSFGDGVTANGRVATHTYTDVIPLNTYPVQLVVAGENGCTSVGYKFIPSCDIYLPVVLRGNS